MISLLVKLFIVLPVTLFVALPAKLIGLGAGLAGQLVGWGVWLALIPMKVLLLPLRLL